MMKNVWLNKSLCWKEQTKYIKKGNPLEVMKCLGKMSLSTSFRVKIVEIIFCFGSILRDIALRKKQGSSDVKMLNQDCWVTWAGCAFAPPTAFPFFIFTKGQWIKNIHSLCFFIINTFCHTEHTLPQSEWETFLFLLKEHHSFKSRLFNMRTALDIEPAPNHPYHHTHL